MMKAGRRVEQGSGRPTWIARPEFAGAHTVANDVLDL
jgi:hypothetical protein